MTLIPVTYGKRAEASDVQQIINWLTGTVGYGGAVLLTQYSSSSAYTFKAKNLDATNSRAMQIQNAEGTDVLTVRRVSGNDVVTIGMADGSQPSTSLFKVDKTITSGAGYVTADFTTTVTSATGDFGSSRSHIRQTSGAADIRGLESHALRDLSAGSGAEVTWGAEIGVHTRVLGSGPFKNVGIYLYSDCGTWYGVAGERANTGLLIGGSSGFQKGIAYYDTDNSTLLFSVDQAGGTISGTHLSLTSNAYDMGATNNLWANIYGTRLLAGTGTVGAPSITFNGDTDNGLYLSAANAVAMATAGALRTIWDATGNIVNGTGTAVGTTATDGFIYLPIMAGTPTGVPTSYANRLPIQLDSSGNKLWAYVSGAWKSVTFA